MYIVPIWNFYQAQFPVKKVTKVCDNLLTLQLVNNAATQVEIFAGGTLEMVLFGKKCANFRQEFSVKWV